MIVVCPHPGIAVNPITRYSRRQNFDALRDPISEFGAQLLAQTHAMAFRWRLWKSGAKKRILFLVDRNILADQTKTNDFKPFGKALTKILSAELCPLYV